MRLPTLAVLLSSCLLASSAGAQTEILELIPADNAAWDEFGGHVALSGRFALASAASKTVGQKDFAGEAYVFDATTGQELLQLTASPLHKGDLFGHALAPIEVASS